MKKRLRFASAIVVVALLSWGGWFFSHPREPEYQGTKLSVWLLEIKMQGPELTEEQNGAMQAVKQLGSDAIPFLLQMVKAKDSQTKKRVAGLLRDLFGWRVKITPAYHWHEGAQVGFSLLGTVAEPAIPTLAREITNKDSSISYAAKRALVAIGSSNCVPVLVHALSNVKTENQPAAARLVTEMRSKAKAAAPLFLSRLDDGDRKVQMTAMYALAAIGGEPQIVVPALSRKLTNSDAGIRGAAARWLGAFSPEARSATAALLEATQDPDEDVRKAALASLLRVQCEMKDGGIFHGPKEERKIALVFTGHEFAEGGETILQELEKHRAKASFFLTGDFIANPNFASLIHRMTNNSHYIGPHSNKHLLFCAWDDSKKTLIAGTEFWFDLVANLRKLENIGVKRKFGMYFLPPYEHFNQEITDWSMGLGLTLINYTPGTRSHADYTGEADKNFASSQVIFDSIAKREREDPHGLNGFILLLHIGSGPGRADKFHARFGELLDYLAGKGYEFVRVDELLEPTANP